MPTAIYNGMFSSAFSGKASRWSSFGSRIDKSMGDALSGSDAVKQELRRSMEGLNRTLTETRVVTRENIFQVNAAVADAYKRAFTAGERAAAEIQAKKSRELQEHERKKPPILKDTAPDRLKMLREADPASLSRRDKATLKADEKFKMEQDKISRKYDVPLANLGSQLQRMAANRGFVPAATQGMFDRMRDGTSSRFNGSFEDQIRQVGLMNIQTGAQSGTNKGAINEVYRVQIDEKALFVKPGELSANPRQALDTAAKRGTAKADKAGADPATRDKIMREHALAAMQRTSQLSELGVFTNEEMSGLELPDITRINESAFRDQGAQIVGKLLNVDSIIPSRLAMDDKSGYVSAMDVAPGKRADSYFSVSTQSAVEAAEKRARDIREKCAAAGVEPPQQAMAEAINLSDPSIQKEALELGALDYVCGQFDRHVGNFYISRGADGRYKMTGIDNDGAFGSDAETNRQLPDLSAAVPFVTPELKERIMALKPDEVADSLKGVVDRGENGEEVLQGVRDRVALLQAHVQTVPVIDEKDLNAETSLKLQKDVKMHRPSPMERLAANNADKVLEQADAEADREIAKKQELEARKQYVRDTLDVSGPGPGLTQEEPTVIKPDPEMTAGPATRPRSRSAAPEPSMGKH